MKLTKDEFKKLQLEWYEKLKAMGFKDAEESKDDGFVLAQSASYCFRNVDGLTKFLKEEYYRRMAQESLDSQTVYKNAAHKHILIRHSEGAKIKTIVQELIELGLPRNRNSVRFIIRRYEMLWGFRNYNYKQLNKPKP